MSAISHQVCPNPSAYQREAGSSACADIAIVSVEVSNSVSLVHGAAKEGCYFVDGLYSDYGLCKSVNDWSAKQDFSSSKGLKSMIAAALGEDDPDEALSRVDGLVPGDSAFECLMPTNWLSVFKRKLEEIVCCFPSTSLVNVDRAADRSVWSTAMLSERAEEARKAIDTLAQSGSLTVPNAEKKHLRSSVCICRVDLDDPLRISVVDDLDSLRASLIRRSVEPCFRRPVLDFFSRDRRTELMDSPTRSRLHTIETELNRYLDQLHAKCPAINASLA